MSRLHGSRVRNGSAECGRKGSREIEEAESVPGVPPEAAGILPGSFKEGSECLERGNGEDCKLAAHTEEEANSVQGGKEDEKTCQRQGCTRTDKADIRY